MGKKEANEVRMLGVLPSQGADPIPVGKIPDGGTQTIIADNAANQHKTIYTVNTGKTYFVTGFMCFIFNSSATIRKCYLEVTDGDDNFQYYLCYVGAPIGGAFTESMNFSTLLEVPAGFKFRIYSDGASSEIYVTVFGYEA